MLLLGVPHWLPRLLRGAGIAVGCLVVGSVLLLGVPRRLPRLLLGASVAVGCLVVVLLPAAVRGVPRLLTELLAGVRGQDPVLDAGELSWTKSAEPPSAPELSLPTCEQSCQRIQNMSGN